MTFVESIWLFSALYLVLFAAVSDLRSMRIPNWISVALIVLFAIGIPFGLSENLTAHLIVFGIAALIVLGLFFAKLAGGGDVKLIAALALWMGPAGIVPFILYMALAGGVLAIAAIVLTKNNALAGKEFKNESSWLARLGRGERVVPYGVAIAAGFVAALTNLYF